MGRWEPDAQGRLERAALDLFAERGYDQTTVADIAARAGLTERTFFRYYADKREVLFAGAAAFQETFTRAVESAPASASALEAVGAAAEAAAAALEQYRGRDYARERQQLVAANPELRERELIKLADVATVVAGALRVRGFDEPAASLSAEAGIAVFKIAYARWVEPGQERGFVELVREALSELPAPVPLG